MVHLVEVGGRTVEDSRKIVWEDVSEAALAAHFFICAFINSSFIHSTSTQKLDSPFSRAWSPGALREVR